MSGEAEGEGFLSRWSRRKRGAAEEAEAVEAPLPPVAPETPEGQAVAAAETADSPPSPACPIPNLPAIDLDSLPSIEELTAESDFSLFLRPGVPSLLRNAALRRMWSLDPAIRDFIGPVDYQWDFNTPGGLPFGFSNTLEGDVAKLLAQAIGKIEELAGEEEPEAGDAPSQARVEAEAESQADALEEVPPGGPEGPPVPLAATAPRAGAVALAESYEPPAPRRRHGGALPA